jgi:thymidylate synthase
MNNLDKQYINILKDILENGNKKSDRTGTGTLSLFSRTIRHKMSDGFPIITTKKIHLKGVIEELLWFLQGETNIKPLVDRGVNIWVGDCYKKYRTNSLSELQPMSKEQFIESIKQDKNVVTGKKGFAEKHGDIGPGYGKQWRRWDVIGNLWIDQIQNLINDLKNNPDSRRLMVSAWNVGEIDQMTLPPCHFAFQCYTRELSAWERTELYSSYVHERGGIDTDDLKTDEYFDEIGIPKRALSLMWNQRSVDTFLGLPFNIASYGFLLTMLAQQTNMIPDELIGCLGDTHLYLNHLEAAKEQINSEIFELPRLNLRPVKDIFSYSFDDFDLKNYKHGKKIKATLNN